MTSAGDRALPGFLEEIESSVKRPGGKCWYPNIVSVLSPEDVADLDVALANSKYLSSTITQVLRKRGFNVTENSMRRHRRGDCQCPR